MFYALNVLTFLKIMMLYPKLFSLSPSSPSGDEVCSLLVPGVPGWCRPSLAGWGQQQGSPAQLIVSAPWPTAVSTSHRLRYRYTQTSDSDFSLLGATQGGIQVTGACRWYEMSLSRVDTMLNRLTPLIIRLSYCLISIE